MKGCGTPQWLGSMDNWLGVVALSAAILWLLFITSRLYLVEDCSLFKHYWHMVDAIEKVTNNYLLIKKKIPSSYYYYSLLAITFQVVANPPPLNYLIIKKKKTYIIINFSFPSKSQINSNNNLLTHNPLYLCTYVNTRGPPCPNGLGVTPLALTAWGVTCVRYIL